DRNVTGVQTCALPIFPNSLDAMGFDLGASGFHIVLSRDVPELIRKEVRGLVEGFLARSGLSREDLRAFIVHPGGQKLLTFIEQRSEERRVGKEGRLRW